MKTINIDRFLKYPVKVIEYRNNNDLVACLMFQILEDRLHCYFTIVKEEYRGSGINQMMIKKVIEYAKENGYKRITAQIKANNKSSLSSLNKVMPLSTTKSGDKYDDGIEKMIFDHKV